MAFNTALNEVQKMVVSLYCDGDLIHVDTMEAAEECGDTLFLFLLREAGDAENQSEALIMIDNAREQLESLVDDMRARICNTDSPTP